MDNSTETAEQVSTPHGAWRPTHTFLGMPVEAMPATYTEFSGLGGRPDAGYMYRAHAHGQMRWVTEQLFEIAAVAVGAERAYTHTFRGHPVIASPCTREAYFHMFGGSEVPSVWGGKMQDAGYIVQGAPGGKPVWYEAFEFFDGATDIVPPVGTATGPGFKVVPSFKIVLDDHTQPDSGEAALPSEAAAAAPEPTCTIIRTCSSTPMTLGAYNKLRGWAIPADENPELPGYHMVYGKQPDGTISQTWTPAEDFVQYAHPAGMMPFEAALHLAKQGQKIARTTWNGKGIYVFLCTLRNASNMYAAAMGGQRIAPFLAINTTGLTKESNSSTQADRAVRPWAPSQSDMLANDWATVE